MKLIDKILEEKTDTEMKELFYEELKDFHFITFWEVLMHNLLQDLHLYDELAYTQRRALFIDLVEYYMKKGLLKFKSGEVGLYKWEMDKSWDEVEKQYIDFDHFTPEQMRDFIQEHMPTGNEEHFDEDTWMINFFYGTMPNALYWYDGSDPQFPEPEWILGD